MLCYCVTELLLWISIRGASGGGAALKKGGSGAKGGGCKVWISIVCTRRIMLTTHLFP